MEFPPSFVFGYLLGSLSMLLLACLARLVGARLCDGGEK